MGRSKPQAAKTKSRSSRRKTPQQPPLFDIKLTLDQKLDLLGIVLALTGLLTAFSLLSASQGWLTDWWVKPLKDTFGWGVFVVPLALMATGSWLLLRSFESVPKPSGERVIGLVLAYLAALVTLQVIAIQISGGYDASGQPGAPAQTGGGVLGEALRRMLITAIGGLGTAVLLLAWWMVALVLSLGLTPSQLIGPLVALVTRLRQARQAQTGQWEQTAWPDDRPLVINNGGARHEAQPAEPSPAEPRRKAPAVQPAAPVRILGDTPAAPAGPLSRPAPAAQIVWQLPKLEEMFDAGGDSGIPEEDLRIKANIIEETLHHLGVEGKVVEVNRGPAITQFGVEPGFTTARDGKQTKVKVSRITALADDLALALAAKSIRIEAPVPGRNIVGIEVPNAEIALVALRDVLESEEFEKIEKKSKLAIGLGQDVSGQPVAADLAAMPHLLIAGTTGSGKSVCVNAIITCLLAHNTPDDLRMIMVDPKRVELTGYNAIPHLMNPVVVDLERVVSILQWVTREMDNRYHKFAKAGARNIDEYNKKAVAQTAAQTAAQKETPGQDKLEKLPYIVVIIDELADLMMLAPDETERTICRLAQMARATGIHLILATQRPSVDVVTGLIKANFPARISFAVASSVDSRVILDGPGAEKLLGRGDMLFISPDAGQPVRLQGCWVSDKEITRLTRYWKGMRGATDTAPVPEIPLPETKPPTQQPLWEDLRSQAKEAKENQVDDLLARAIDVVRLQKRASISLLQNKLRIGYTRAARLIDLMEEKGIVGPAEPGARWREVLVTPVSGLAGDDE